MAYDSVVEADPFSPSLSGHVRHARRYDRRFLVSSRRAQESHSRLRRRTPHLGWRRVQIGSIIINRLADKASHDLK